MNTKMYTHGELITIISILRDLGFIVDKYQPHISGERNLMRAVTTKSGKKFILLGNSISNNKRVVIKITNDFMGAKEIQHERVCRNALKNIPFAYNVFLSPKELLYKNTKGYAVFIQEYVKQESTFLELPIEEQFDIVLRAFKAQEGAHVVTHEHKKVIIKTFGSVNANWYLSSYKKFQEDIVKCLPKNTQLTTLLSQGSTLLSKNKKTIEQYGNFLTHTDFVPHNFRVVYKDMYLLDSSSIRFGNKYEGLARFLNFMTLYNKPLEEALLFYIKNNRTDEEYLSLHLMRIYRLGEIIWYYTNLLKETSGDLHRLTDIRIDFWTAVLKATLCWNYVGEDIINKYKKMRDVLRSDDEKRRQKLLH